MTPEQADLNQLLTAKIKVLNELIWEYRCTQPQIDAWLENFQGASATVEEERIAALHAVSHLTYYGLPEIRELLVALYRDYVRQPLVRAIRTADPTLLTVSDLAPTLASETATDSIPRNGQPLGKRDSPSLLFPTRERTAQGSLHQLTATLHQKRPLARGEAKVRGSETVHLSR